MAEPDNSQAIPVTCSHGHSFRAKAKYAGRKGLCPICRIAVEVPAATATVHDAVDISTDRNDAERPKEPVESPAIPKTSGNRRELGRYSILATLGEGAFGTVYRAHDPQLDRVVAIKVPRLGAMLSTKDKGRFLREARAAAQLRHPNIVPIFDAGELNGTYYIASAFIPPGRTLRDRIREESKFDQRTATQLIKQIAMALHYAHSQGIVHRDVKPDNVLLDAAGVPHIADFGLARRAEGEELLTQDGSRMGTPAYMSPELHRGKSHEVDGRSDQWALGVMLYEMLTGQRPFRGDDQIHLMHAVLDTEPSSLRKLDGTISQDLETICLKCLAKEPEARYASCELLADDLMRWQRDEPIRARRVNGAERCWRWAKRNPITASLTALIVLVTVLGFSGVLSMWAVAESHLRDATEQRGIAEKNSREAEQQRTDAVQSRLLAQQNEATANRERDRALEQERLAKQREAELGTANEKLRSALEEVEKERLRANSAGELATTSQQKAEAEAKAAGEAIRKAELSTQALAQEAYYGVIRRANREIAAGNRSGVAESLLGCPTALRNWEWNRLASLAGCVGNVSFTLPTTLDNCYWNDTGTWMISSTTDGITAVDLVSGTSSAIQAPQASSSTGQANPRNPRQEEPYEPRLMPRVRWSSDGQRVLIGHQAFDLPARACLGQSSWWDNEIAQCLAIVGGQLVMIDAQKRTEIANLQKFLRGAKGFSVSPNGRYLVVDSGKDKLAIFDRDKQWSSRETSTLFPELFDLLSASHYLFALDALEATSHRPRPVLSYQPAWSPDSSKLMAGIVGEQSKGYNTAPGESVRPVVIGMDGSVRLVPLGDGRKSVNGGSTFPDDGCLLAWGSRSELSVFCASHWWLKNSWKSLHWLDLKTGRTLVSPTLVASHRASFSPSESLGAAITKTEGDSVTWSIIELATGKERFSIPANDGEISWSNSGDYVATSRNGPVDGKAHRIKAEIWNTSTGKIHESIEDPTESVTSVKLLDSPRRVGFLMGNRLVIRPYAQVPFKGTFRVAERAGAIKELQWHPSGASIGDVASSARLTVSPAAEDLDYKGLRTLEGANCVAWHPDERSFLVGNRNGVIQSIDADTGKELLQWKAHDSECRAIEWDREGKHVATGGVDAQVKYWSMDENPPRQVANVLCTEAAGSAKVGAGSTSRRPVVDVTWNPLRMQLAFAGGRDVHHWLPAEGNSTNVLKGHTDNVLSLDWSPDGKYLVSSSADKTCRIWSIPEGNCVAILAGHSGAVTSVSWHPVYNRVATSSIDKTVRLWEPLTGMEIMVIAEFKAAVEVVKWSPNGQNLAVGTNNGQVEIIDSGVLPRKIDSSALLPADASSTKSDTASET